MERTVSCLWKEPNVLRSYSTGISLHSHTNQSQESLSFIGDFINKRPALRRWLDGKKRRSVRITATSVKLSDAYWTPPLTPQAAFQLETEQIKSTLGLAKSFVSISDHDTIGAPMALRVLPESKEVPVSVEWTVPFGEAIFHFGIHNLPGEDAELAMWQFREYTQNPQRERFTELLQWLHAKRDILIVLNHPLWDLADIGAARHEQALHKLLLTEGERIHALELSGIRSWEENQSTRRLAESFNQMIVSGGDRHGIEPNATLNLTNAKSFDEFVHEIRRERRGHVLFMPQYRQSMVLRNLQTVLSVVRNYPDFPNGFQRWDDRVFHPDRSGNIRALSTLWKCPPAYITSFFVVLGLLDVKAVRHTLHAVLQQPAERFAALNGGREEVAQ